MPSKDSIYFMAAYPGLFRVVKFFDTVSRLQKLNT